MQYAILDDQHNPIEVTMTEWGLKMESHDWRTVQQDTIGDVFVSTVFLGVNHAFNNGPDMWFESMIFGGPHDGEQDRYTTWDQAFAGHAAMLELAKGTS